MSDAVQVLHEELSVRLDQIKRLFKPDAGTKVTLVVRNTAVEGDAGLVISDDDLGIVIEEIKRRCQQ